MDLCIDALDQPCKGIHLGPRFAHQRFVTQHFLLGSIQCRLSGFCRGTELIDILWRDHLRLEELFETLKVALSFIILSSVRGGSRLVRFDSSFLCPDVSNRLLKCSLPRGSLRLRTCYSSGLLARRRIEIPRIQFYDQISLVDALVVIYVNRVHTPCNLR